ncbi:alpha/beta hydrolase family protein [Sphingomonas abietis]|uniref:Uncharacterized protein n=1 Tax=Sphingomonas abietis TaxID=3012344 RepID=A0ABY7NT40_9SPHN|nr:hypothetical protein [Sphingomonas abietis]WBO24110.1 hypothetical protein PBT88_08380 [Sphingomonas abietis]
MTGRPRVHSYADGEFMLAYGPIDGPQILVLQPLFEEMNRCRAFVAGLCRTLAARGIGCWLPDLPGAGESMRALESVGWADWNAASDAAAALIAAETGIVPLSVSIRGGALIEPERSPRRWRFSPTTGRSLLSDLRRSALASGSDPATPAGYRIGSDLVAGLETANLPAGSPIRTLRLMSDDREADRRIEGSPIWRRPEPISDPTMLMLVADDITDWTRA